jgi:hypothetical protein
MDASAGTPTVTWGKECIGGCIDNDSGRHYAARTRVGNGWGMGHRVSVHKVSVHRVSVQWVKDSGSKARARTVGGGEGVSPGVTENKGGRCGQSGDSVGSGHVGGESPVLLPGAKGLGC